MREAKGNRDIVGINISRHQCFTHMRFVNYSLFVGENSLHEWRYIHRILQSFSSASGLTMNGTKSQLLHADIEQGVMTQIRDLFGIKVKHIKEGLNYLGYQIKPFEYFSKDWEWMIERLKKKLESWKCRWYLWATD